jgi:chromosome segregation ATPase
MVSGLQSRYASFHNAICRIAMTSAARVNAETTGSPAAIAQQLARTTGDLETLRAALDAKLARLEAALAGTDDSESLETLIIDLARVATREADAAATRGSLEARLAAEHLSDARGEAARAVESERTAVQTLRAQLDAAQATADNERQAAAGLEREAEELREALRVERANERALRQEVEEAERRLFVVETVKERELADLREHLGVEHASERADAAHLEQTLKALHDELDAAREACETRQHEIEAAREACETRQHEIEAAHARIEAAERRGLEIDRERHEADERTEAARLEAAAIASQLHAAQEAADRQAAATRAVEAQLADAERRLVDQERQHRETCEAIAEAARRDVDTLAGELQAAREIIDQRVAALQAMQTQLATTEREAAHQHRLHREAAEALADATGAHAALAADLDAARAAADAAAELRLQLDAVDTERTTIALALKDTDTSLELVTRERDSVLDDLEAARRDAQLAAAAVAAAETRYDDLRESSAARIRELELALLEVRTRRLGDAAALIDSGDGEIEDDLGAQLWAADGSDVIELEPEPPAAEAPSLIPPARRTERQPIAGDLEVQVDEMPAVLVDLSVNGAQILSPTALKPNRSVTLLLPVGERSVLCKGKIVWARLEASSEAIRYRGGIFFTHVEQRAIEAFLAGDSSYQPKTAPPAPPAATGQSLSDDADSERQSPPVRAAGSAR